MPPERDITADGDELGALDPVGELDPAAASEVLETTSPVDPLESMDQPARQPLQQAVPVGIDVQDDPVLGNSAM